MALTSEQQNAANAAGVAVAGIKAGDIVATAQTALKKLGSWIGIKGKAKSSGRKTTDQIFTDAFGSYYYTLKPYWSKDGGLLPDLNAYSDAVVRVDYWFSQWDHNIITQATLEALISNLCIYMANKGAAAYNADPANQQKLEATATGAITVKDNSGSEAGGVLALLAAAGGLILIL